MHFRFDAELFEWEAQANWFFVAMPEELGADVAEVPRLRRGFGAVRVRARIGSTTWTTSMFPSEGSYVLPLKKAVRAAEGIAEGDTVTVILDVLE